MRPRIELPAPFDSTPFRVRDAIAGGIGHRRLDGRDLARPFWGVRTPAASGDPVEAAAATLRPGDRFSHTTAAEILGVPLPRFAEGRVHITAGTGLRMPRSAGVIGHEDDGRAVIEVGGFPCSTPEEVFVSLGGILPVPFLVAVGDFMVLDPRRREQGRPWSTIERLGDAVEEVGRRGIRRARTAADLVRVDVESPRETVLRLILVAAGLPEPVCGFEVRDRLGRWIGWFDLAWPQFRVLGEYDGDQHRTSTLQYDRDLRRVDAVRDDGWAHLRVRASGLGPGAPETVTRFRRALVAGGWRP
jgi:very-short-patch-repair endonuclease